METKQTHWRRLAEIALVFLKLGLTAFGGPATAVAMMRQEFVLKRKWLSEEEFLDFWGISNLIPGPNATELAMYIGRKQAGWPGLVTAGVFYIVPAMLIVMVMAWAYVQFGSLPALDGILSGIKPVVVAILVSALIGMVKPRLRNIIGLVIAAAVLLAYLLGLGPLPLLLGGGAVMGLVVFFMTRKEQPPHVSVLAPWFLFLGRRAASPGTFNLWRLMWVFLKAGALMYGSGYVLLAFIQDDLVDKMGWLSQAQLVDAIAVGQVTPGPLATTATFVGYLMGGVPAALLATLAMFLPGFLFAALTHPLLVKLRESDRARSFLDGVVFAALGLMAGITWQIGAAALTDPISIGVALVALFLLLRYELPAPWLILGGAVVGVVSSLGLR
ncbi:MAG: chromate efflux transporter [Anaerolineaceae bacterium]|nr:chromate efflux transporter [Anaerolineaceae bacterium]